MAGAWTTLAILDGGGTSRTMRVWDESGAGTGPYSFGQVLSEGDGSGPVNTLTVIQPTGTNLHAVVDAATGLAQGSTTSGQTGSMVMGAVTTAAPSYTNAQTSPVSLTTAGAQRHDVSSVGGTAYALGTNSMANSMPVTIATDGVVSTAMSKFSTGYYVTVAASQTAASIKSSTGAVGDYLDYVIVIPATTAPGVVTILDGTSGPTTVVAYPGGGTTALLTLTPFTIPVGAVSRVAGGWYITTGANVSVLAVGKFS